MWLNLQTQVACFYTGPPIFLHYVHCLLRSSCLKTGHFAVTLATSGRVFSATHCGDPTSFCSSATLSLYYCVAFSSAFGGGVPPTLISGTLCRPRTSPLCLSVLLRDSFLCVSNHFKSNSNMMVSCITELTARSVITPSRTRIHVSRHVHSGSKVPNTPITH